MAVLGFIPNQQQNNRWALNGRQKVSLVWHIIGAAANIAFILVEANSIEEFMYAIFVAIISSGCVIGFICIIYKNDEIFYVIEDCEKELTTSKSCLILKENISVNIATDNFFHFKSICCG